MTDIDVLIIGGGPTGLMLALELAVQKISFRIVDKATQRSPYSRALIVHPRSCELLNRHGDVNELRARGFEAVGITVAVNGKKVADIDTDFVGITSTAFPAPMGISQAETELWMERTLAKHGASVEMGVEAKDIQQHSDHVSVGLVFQDGKEETVRAKYVVGADGAHSTVRHAAKTLTFEGDAYPQEFILADTHVRADVPMDRAYMCLGRGVCMYLPMQKGTARVVVSRSSQPTATQPTLEDFRGFLEQVFPGKLELYDPIWLQSFRLHHRGVNKYREGRLFVAGDAAHIHSPAGGQGMNTGIQDAANLGWKLAAVIRGEQPDSFLDSYNAERRPVGQHLLQSSDRNFTWETTTNPLFLLLRNTILPWVLPWIVSNPQRVLQGFKFMTQFGIRYSRSPIVGTATGFNGPVKGGSRAVEGFLEGPNGNKRLQELLTPESHHLALFSGLGSNAAGQYDLQHAEAKYRQSCRTSTKVHIIYGQRKDTQSGYFDTDGATHKAYGFGAPGYVLVRPDSHVAHIGPLSALDDLVQWLQ